MPKRVSKQDAVKAKAAKQKKIAIGGGVLLVALLVFQVPRTMKLLNQKPAPPLNAPVAAATTPTVTPSDPNSLAAPTLAGTPTADTTTTTSDLVDAVPVAADPGQLEAFQKFASKDPFAVQVAADGSAPSSGSSSPSGGSTTTQSTPTSTTPITTPPSTPTQPSTQATPAPTSAIVSLNGELMSVAAGTDFPTSGATFTRAGTLFHLVSVSAKTAKIAIVGGSYADGAPAITLKMRVPLTLQNTADGTKYTLILEPPTTQLPAGTGTVAPAPTSTTPVSAVPSGSGG